MTEDGERGTADQADGWSLRGLTAELGRRFAVDAWIRLAGQRAAELARAAGPYAPNITVRIGQVLG